MKHCDGLSRCPVIMIVKNEFLIRIKGAQNEDEHLKAINKILQSNPYDDY